MTPREFDHQINRLKNCFSEKAYSDERTKLLWRELQDLDGRWFAKVVDQFIGNESHAPLLPKFREEIEAERERLWKLQKQHRPEEPFVPKNAQCMECDDSGIVWQRKNDGTPTEGTYWYRCYCFQGRKRTEKYPTYQHGQRT